ncbi:B-cell receptor CD22 [Pholidichthys leucotaenia]
MIMLLLCLMVKSAGAVNAVWSVTFENPNYCVLKGSSVEFLCSYNYLAGKTVRKTAWYKGQSEDGIWKRIELSELPSYQNRSEYVGDKQHDCRLVIHNLQKNDTGYYYFAFDTDMYAWHSKNSVYLSVTEVKARVHPQRVRAGNTVTLQCETSCPLHRTRWLRNGHNVTTTKFQAQAEDAGNYSCVVEARELLYSHPVALDVQYSPLNVSVGVSPAGLLTAGSSVNLTCITDANPVAEDYTWYRYGSKLETGSGRVLSFSPIEVSHTGLYLCQARNSLGEKNSTEVLLVVEEANNVHYILLVGMGVKVIIALLLPLAIIWAWRSVNNSEDNETQSHDYENMGT